MQYQHGGSCSFFSHASALLLTHLLAGISAVTALPFSPPIAYRVTPRPHPAKKEKSEIVEGKCHKCRKWVAIEGVKDMEIKVRSRWGVFVTRF